MKHILKILILVFVFQNAISQTDTTKLVKYTPAFKFREGFYLHYEQMKENSPILKSRIVSNIRINDLNFFEKILQNKKILFYDEYGIKQEIKVEDLWGYSRKGTLYVQVEGEFNRIPVVGKVCHFVANVTVYKDRMYSPYDNYYNYNSTLRPQQTSYELKQFLLDFDTGRIMEYNMQTLSVILMRDSELYNEFNEIKKRKRKQLMFVYLRKYNEKHPLYIPVHYK